MSGFEIGRLGDWGDGLIDVGAVLTGIGFIIGNEASEIDISKGGWNSLKCDELRVIVWLFRVAVMVELLMVVIVYGVRYRLGCNLFLIFMSKFRLTATKLLENVNFVRKPKQT